MPIVIQLPSGERREIRHDPITIGRGPNCHVSLPGEGRLKDEHARLRRIAGRWLVESLGDWPIQAGNGTPSRLSWLNVGDVIRLAQGGPELIFEPAQEDVVLDSIAPSPALATYTSFPPL